MSNQLEKNSAAVRKKLEARKFTGEDGEEYGASRFGEFGDYFRRKKLKLHNEDIIMRNSVQGKPQIFKDVVAHVASYTQPPPEELRRLLILHGAQFIKYLDFKTMVTHIIVSTLPPKKADEWRRLRVVKPAWVVDSVAAGKILPWSDYRLINDDPQQKQIQFGGGKMAVGEAIPNQMAGYREQSKNSFYTEQVRELAAAQDNKRQASSLFPQLETLAADEGSFDPAEDSNDHDINMDDNSFFSPREDERSGPDADNEGCGKLGEHSRENDETGNGKSDVRSVDEIVDVPGMESVAEDNIEDVEDTYVKQDDDDDSTLIQGPCESKEEHKEFTTILSPGKAPQSPLGKKAIMTPEEHNALLLADPKIRKASTANPDFLKQFYSESRLHHLSTWKAELKSKMQRRAAEKASQVVQQKGQVKRKPGARRYIMHVDFDSFFCAVSLKSAPDYVDKPAVVAHSTGSGSEIASCNYPARKFGVKNGMWMKRAMELCPDLKVLPYDFPAYEEASELFYEAILDVGGVVQSVSVDEALVDITSIVLSETASWGVGVSEGSIWREQEKANEIGTKLRQQIKDKTGCNVSVGIGGNILLAKVALRRAKPAGQYQIRPEEVLSLLGELEVEKLPGVAYSIGGKLEEIGVRLVQDLRNVSKERLVAVLGPKTGERLWEYARGIDRTEVGDQPVRKSVSAEVNWGIRFISQEEAEEFVMNLCKELERRLLNEQVRGRSLTMKILRRSADAPLDPEKHLGHGKCDVFNKSVAFGVAVHDAETIGKEAVSILRSFRFSPGDLRGMGVQLQKLEPIKTAFSVSDGSQKKLTFGKATPAAERKEPEGGKPGKIISSGDQAFSFSLSSSLAAAAASGDQDNKTKSPHIIPSTQFFMPMNPDPSVLAELPPDIIRRLVAQPSGDTGANNNNSGRNNIPSPVNRESRASSPAAASIHSASAADDLPSDIDPDVFEALPPDMQVEILAEYRQHGRQQSGSPAPSPRRRMAASTMRSGTSASTRGGLGKKVAGRSPVKRGIWGTRGLAAAAAARERKHDAEANRVQTSLFVPAAAPAVSDIAADDDNNGNNGNATDFLLEELDPEVLAALPEDVRAEVLENHMRQQQAQQAQSMLHLEIPENRAGRLGANATTTAAGQERGQTLLNFPSPPPKMSFRTATAIGDDASSAVLLSFDKIKDMLKTWHNTTRHDGPHETDVAVLERYLAGVVTQERDMEKARKLVVWLEWLVEEDDGMGAEGNNAPGKHGWTLAVARIKVAVQEAMRSRGLGPLQFV